MADKVTPQEFAARIRSKYPGMYDDIPDQDLTRRIVTKYPQYRDMITSPENPIGAKPVKLQDGSTVPFSELYKPSMTNPIPHLYNSGVQDAIGRLASGVGRGLGLPSSIEEYGQQLLSSPGSPVGAAHSAYQYGKNLVSKLGEASQEARDVGENIAAGGPTGANIGKAAYSLADVIGSIIPGGQSVMSAGKSIAQGDVAGGVGEVAGLAAPIALGDAQVRSGMSKLGTNIPKIAKSRASNLAAALEMGASAPKSKLMFEDVALPSVDDIRYQAQVQGKKLDSFKGREGYVAAKELTGGNRIQYDNAFDSIMKPFEKAPAGKSTQLAAKDFVSEVIQDARQVDAFTQTNTASRYIAEMAQEISNIKTLGELNEYRKTANIRAEKLFGGLSSAEAGRPFAQVVAARIGDAIREHLYSDIAERYGPQSGITAASLREFQKRHGNAITMDNMMEQTMSKVSSAASLEEAATPLGQKLARGASPATYSAKTHAVGGLISSIISPSTLKTFNVQWQRVIQGTDVKPFSAPTPKGAPRSIGPLPGKSPAQVLKDRIIYGTQDITPRTSSGLEGYGLERPLPSGFVSKGQGEVNIPREFEGQALTPPESVPITSFQYDPTLSTYPKALPPARSMVLDAPDYIPTGEPMQHLPPKLLKERAKYDTNARAELIRRRTEAARILRELKER